MDWASEAEGGVLDQILALLVSFAALADRVAFLPFALQLPALAFMAQAEAVARFYVVGLPTGLPSRGGDRATRLGRDFRALASMLRAAIARSRRLAGVVARAARPSLPPRGPAAPKAFCEPAGQQRYHGPAPPAPVTSRQPISATQAALFRGAATPALARMKIRESRAPRCPPLGCRPSPPRGGRSPPSPLSPNSRAKDLPW